MRKPPRDHIAIPADLARIADVRRFAARLLSHAGVKGTPADEIVLALSEIVQNAVEHGVTSNGTRIQVRVTCVGGLVRLEVEERFNSTTEAKALARMFADAKVPPVDDERGRGLWLVRAMLDRVEVQPLPGGGLIVRGEKKVP